MGLFDRFKKKKNPPAPQPREAAPPPSFPTPRPPAPEPQAQPELYRFLSRYNEYIMYYISLQHQRSIAPIGAYEQADGELVGFLYVTGEDDAYGLSAREAVERMEARFEAALADGGIRSYVILYHSQFAHDNNHRIAERDEELKAITVAYHFKDGPSGKAGLPYVLEEDRIAYQGFSGFSRAENDALFNTPLKEGYEYFGEKEPVAAPAYVNAAGIRMKKSNMQDLANTWGGIFGFESHRTQEGWHRMSEYYALAATQEPVYTDGRIEVTQLVYQDVRFKAILLDGEPQTILPVVRTAYSVPVLVKEIEEWEHVSDLEAVVGGKARDTLGIWFLATDYAEHRQRYQSGRGLDVQLSGIALVLDRYAAGPDTGELQYADDFTAYMPSKDLPHNACFDFIGQIEELRETDLLEGGSLKAWILRMRLITNSEVPDFFTIDMYATGENMRFERPEIGMRITGLFQLQGQLAG